MGCRLDDLSSILDGGVGIFLFISTSRLSLASDQPFIQWVRWAVSSEGKWVERDAVRLGPSSTERRKQGALPPPHIYAFIA
jgi:hypothetical protein